MSNDFLPQNVNLKRKNVKKTNLEFLKLCYRTLRIKQKVRIKTFKEIHLSNGMEICTGSLKCKVLFNPCCFRNCLELKELFELMTDIDLLKAER